MPPLVERLGHKDVEDGNQRHQEARFFMSNDAKGEHIHQNKSSKTRILRFDAPKTNHEGKHIWAKKHRDTAR